MAGDEVAEGGGVAGNALGELGAAVVEHVLERLQPRRQHLAHRFAAVADHVGEALGALSKLVGDPVAALDDGVGDAGAGLLELGDHVTAAQAQVEHQRIAGVLEGGVYPVSYTHLDVYKRQVSRVAIRRDGMASTVSVRRVGSIASMPRP